MAGLFSHGKPRAGIKAGLLAALLGICILAALFYAISYPAEPHYDASGMLTYDIIGGLIWIIVLIMAIPALPSATIGGGIGGFISKRFFSGRADTYR
jgi:hypothetical protein